MSVNPSCPRCPCCGGTFSCCMEDGNDRGACWCMQAPALSGKALQEIAADYGAARCLCAACLRARSVPPAAPTPA